MVCLPFWLGWTSPHPTPQNPFPRPWVQTSGYLILQGYHCGKAFSPLSGQVLPFYLLPEGPLWDGSIPQMWLGEPSPSCSLLEVVVT